MKEKHWKAINQSSAESSSSWVRDSKKKKGAIERERERGAEVRGRWRMQQPLQNLSEEAFNSGIIVCVRVDTL